MNKTKREWKGWKHGQIRQEHDLSRLSAPHCPCRGTNIFLEYSVEQNDQDKHRLARYATRQFGTVDTASCLGRFFDWF